MKIMFAIFRIFSQIRQKAEQKKKKITIYTNFFFSLCLMMNLGKNSKFCKHGFHYRLGFLPLLSNSASQKMFP